MHSGARSGGARRLLLLHSLLLPLLYNSYRDECNNSYNYSLIPSLLFWGEKSLVYSLRNDWRSERSHSQVIKVEIRDVYVWCILSMRNKGRRHGDDL